MFKLEPCSCFVALLYDRQFQRPAPWFESFCLIKSDRIFIEFGYMQFDAAKLLRFCELFNIVDKLASDIVNRAFEGADAVFWLVPADKNAESIFDAYVRFSIPAANATVRYRVGRVVAISALGRGQQRYAGNISASLATPLL